MLKPILLSVLLLLAQQSHGYTKVGNGDDGADLEDLTEVQSGRLEDTRKLALERLKAVGASGVPYLGQLTPEVRNTTLYLTRENMLPRLPDELRNFPEPEKGIVFARTFAEPHAATRFSPAALELTDEQLIALHIHEALHRALPPKIRRNETAVAEITLSLTSTDASYDRVKETVLRYMEGYEPGRENHPLVDHYTAPSNVGYRFRSFVPSSITPNFPVLSMHAVHSELYPFGGPNAPFGMGVEGSLLQRPGGAVTGPLALSARLRIWSYRGFDVGLFAKASLNTLSAEELKNSPFGRDVYSLGITLIKDIRNFYVENAISYDGPGKATQRLGAIDYRYNYGSVTMVKLRAGGKFGPVRLGAFTEIYLADYLKVAGGAFSYDSGRYRIVSAGPEMTWVFGDTMPCNFTRVIW